MRAVPATDPSGVEVQRIPVALLVSVMLFSVCQCFCDPGFTLRNAFGVAFPWFMSIGGSPAMIQSGVWARKAAVLG